MVCGITIGQGSWEGLAADWIGGHREERWVLEGWLTLLRFLALSGDSRRVE